MKEVFSKEILKLLDLGIIYLIFDCQWVGSVCVVPKKSDTQVVENEQKELIAIQLEIRWRVCIHYKKLNKVTHKDHFPLPFID